MKIRKFNEDNGEINSEDSNKIELRNSIGEIVIDYLNKKTRLI